MRDREPEQTMDGFKAADGERGTGFVDLSGEEPKAPVIVICEECGRKYRIDTGSIAGEAMGFACRSCGNRILVNRQRPDALGLGPVEEGPLTPPAPEHRARKAAEPAPQVRAEAPSLETAGRRRTARRPLGQTARRVIMTSISLMIAFGAGFLFLCHMESLMRDLNRVSAQVLNRIAEEKIIGISASVAAQCRTYLMAHPDLTGADFARDPAFGAIARQPVGKTGATALYGRGDTPGAWRVWVNNEPMLSGSDLAGLRAVQGGHFDGFLSVLNGVRAEAASTGYYLWRESDGKFREKFMACTTVPGTAYVIAAALDVEELEAPARAVEKRISEITRAAGNGGVLLFGAAAAAILGMALFGLRPTRRAPDEGRGGRVAEL